jgi:hypothetical protein
MNMNIVTVKNPGSHDTGPIENGVIEYGLSLVGGEPPKKCAFHVDGNTQTAKNLCRTQSDRIS